MNRIAAQFPMLLQIIPVQMHWATDDDGHLTLVSLDLVLQLVSMLDVNPARCVRRIVIDSHLRGNVSPN